MDKMGYIGSTNPEILILGTYPGKKTLEEFERLKELGKEKEFVYYQSNRNQFWDILTSIIVPKRPLDNNQSKINYLEENKIVLWDLFYTCEYKSEKNASQDKKRIFKKEYLNDLSNIINKESLRVIIINGRGSKYKLYGEWLGDKYPLIKDKIKNVISSSGSSSVKIEEKKEKWRGLINSL